MVAPPLLTSVVFLLACCTHSIRGDDDERFLLETKFGPVLGRVRQGANGQRVKELLRMPYAKPPVGELRFQHPVDAFSSTTNYSEVPWDAGKMPPACPQYSEQPSPWYDSEPGQSEDCLYYNIWAPADVGDSLRPVKIYIHGGGWFEYGSNRMAIYDGFGEALDTLDEDGNSKQDGIIVATVNYRLGALGFLTTSSSDPFDGDDDGPGNMGLYDIKMAIDSITWNAGYLGGDNGRFFDYLYQKTKPKYMPTVVGQGSGAILASLLLFTGSSSHLIHTVFNGATLFTLNSLEGVDGDGNSHQNNLRLTNLLAKAVGCSTIDEKKRPESTADTLKCLRGVEASRLVRAAASLSRERRPPNVFMPQLDGPRRLVYDFSEEPIFKALRSATRSRSNRGYTSSLNTLGTFTTDEGSELLTSAFPELFGTFGEKDVPLSAACTKKIGRRLLKKFPVTVADELLGDLDRDPTIDNKKKLAQAVGDAIFKCPMIFFFERMKKTAAEFQEEWEVPENSLYILEKKVDPPYNPWASWMGSVGFDNVQLDFVYPDGLTVGNETYTYTDEQSEQVRVHRELIRSFMDQQNNTELDLPIPEFTLADPRYSVLDSNGELSDGSNYHSRNCDILRPYFEYREEEPSEE